MKKLLSLMLALLLVFSLAACGDGAKTGGDADPTETAFARYEAANQKLSGEDVKSIEMDMTMVLDLKTAGESMTVNNKTSIKMIMPTGEGKIPDMAMNMEMEEMPEANMEMYLVDGLMYMDMQGMKIKMDVTGMKEFQDIIAQSEEQVAGVEITKEMLKKVEVKELENDQTEIRFELKEEFGKDLMAFFGDITSMLGEDGSVDITAIEYILVLDKDDNMLEYKINMDMAVIAQNEKVTAHVEASTDYIAVNKITEIKLPGSVDDYMEIDPSALGQ